MKAKDGSIGFDCDAVYIDVLLMKKLEYIGLGDRTVTIHFEAQGENTRVIETFDVENKNPVKLQKASWLAIFTNFRIYAESV
jgi:hypothetical protein